MCFFAPVPETIPVFFPMLLQHLCNHHLEMLTSDTRNDSLVQLLPFFGFYKTRQSSSSRTKPSATCNSCSSNGPDGLQPATSTSNVVAGSPCTSCKKRHMQQAAPYQTRDPNVVVSPGVALTVRRSTCTNHGLNTIHTQARGLSQDGPRATSSILVDMMHVTNHFVTTDCAMALCILVHAFRFGYKFRKNTDYIISKELGTFSRSKKTSMRTLRDPKISLPEKAA